MNTDILLDLTNTILMGILLGGLYALIALGLSLVFGVMKMINVAHGDLILFGTYFSYGVMMLLGIDPVVSLIAGVPIMFVMGYAIQKYLMSRAFNRSMEAPLLIAFGISLMLQNLQQILWSPMSKGLTTSYALDSFEFAAGDQFVELRPPDADHTSGVVDPNADRLDRMMAAHSAGSSSR